MNESTDILHEAKRLRLLAAALELQHYTRPAANLVEIPGTEQVIAIGTPAQVASLLEISPVPTELIRLGSIMASTLYNLKQQAGKPLDERTCGSLGQLQQQWDAARRDWREAVLEHLAADAQAMGGYDTPAGATDSEGGHHD
jgi:hypothetical protein